MKIGIYDPYLDDLGGGEKYMMTIAECLSQDHEVTVFWDNKEDLSMLVDRFSLELTRVAFTKNIFHSDVSFFQRFMESRKYDAIIILSDGSIPLLFSKKLFIHIQQPLEQFEKGSFKDNFKLRRVTAFFCNSEYTKSFINKKFNLKTLVIYPPVWTNAKKVKKENIILHVGRFRVKNMGIDDYKKQQVMINGFKKMVDHGLENWKFVIAASVREQDTAEFERVKKETKGYPISFLVNKKNDELWDEYSKAKIYWHASGYGEDLIAHPEFAEHFGISTVEAMSAGVVPVVINVGGQKEIVTEGKDGLFWNTLEDLEKQTKRLITDENLWEKLSAVAVVRSKDFSKEKFYERIIDLLKL